MRSRAAVPAMVGLTLLLAVGFLVLGRPARSAGGHAGHTEMSDVAMKRWSDAWWAAHPRVGASSAQPAAATFTVANTIFDADGNLNTQVDEVTISVGESVTWQWVSGFHTITNGTGFEDPQAGSLFDQPSDPGHTQFTFVFNAPGAYPFFCRPHEGLSMTGVVNVEAAASVDPGGAALGFTAGPSPRPTRTGVSFGFALRTPGRVRAEVLDATGRRVATVLDRDYAAGAHTGAWDGRTARGARVDAGVYFLRLRLPDYDRSRAIVIAR